MTKHVLLWLALLVSSLSSGCGDVESCLEVTTPGCLNSQTLPTGGCLFDLVPRAGKCVKAGSAEDFCSFCAANTLCVPEKANNQCVDFCQVPAQLPGSVKPPEPIFCVATKTSSDATDNPMLSFDEVCKRRCRLNQRRYAQFCPGYVPPEGVCDSADVQNQCATDCPLTATGARDLACLTASCNDVRFSRCESRLVCPNAAVPTCASVTCGNECSVDGYSFIGDGVCDDGDAYSSAFARCAWGSDCADCGARPSATAPAPEALGGICAYNGNCAGGTGSPRDATAWCIGQNSLPGVSRCMADCSRGQACPSGFECREAKFVLAAGQPATQKVDGEYSSSACVPTACM